MLVDAWFFRPRDLGHATRGVRRAGAGLVVEVWCDVPIGIAKERYARRVRHPVHGDTRDMTREWDRWHTYGEPLGMADVIRVNTAVPVRIEPVGEAVSRSLGHGTSTGVDA